MLRLGLKNTAAAATLALCAGGAFAAANAPTAPLSENLGTHGARPGLLFNNSLIAQIKGVTAQADAIENALNPNEWRSFKLAEKKQLTGNVWAFTFELPSGQAAILPVASCLVTKAALEVEGEDKPKVIVRPYTPVSSSADVGRLEMVIKVYPKGKMSKHIGELKVGDTLEFKGPIPKYPYKPNIKKKIGMIAGGSGLTPMLQVVDEILKNPDDKTEVSFIFANLTESDIILKDKIDNLAKQHSNFKPFYVVDKANYGGLFWKGGLGRVTKQIVQEHLPPPDNENLIMVCGPPGMMNAISGDKAQDKSQGELKGVLKEAGYTESMVFKF